MRECAPLGPYSGYVTTVKSRDEDDAIFDCVTQETERQRVKRPEHADAIDSAAKKIMNLVKDGKLEENLMLVEFTRAMAGGYLTVPVVVSTGLLNREKDNFHRGRLYNPISFRWWRQGGNVGLRRNSGVNHWSCERATAT